MTEELTMQEKALTMFKIGLIMQHDFDNPKRIDERWKIHQTVRQMSKDDVVERQRRPVITEE